MRFSFYSLHPKSVSWPNSIFGKVMKLGGVLLRQLHFKMQRGPNKPFAKSSVKQKALAIIRFGFFGGVQVLLFWFWFLLHDKVFHIQYTCWLLFKHMKKKGIGPNHHDCNKIFLIRFFFFFFNLSLHTPFLNFIAQKPKHNLIKSKELGKKKASFQAP